VQKFTRPITREVELEGQRFAVTFGEQGLSVRPVGSRKAAREMPWSDVLTAAGVMGTNGQGAGNGSSLGGRCAELLARLERWLSQRRPRYHEGLLRGASHAELEALAADLGLPLPPDLKALLAWHNGQSEDFVGRFEQSWALMGAERIRDAKRELDADAKRTGWQRTWVPFLDDDAGDYLCLDTSQPGSPVREFWQGRTEHAVIASSLTAWLEGFVAVVERGGYVQDPERGTFVRQGK